MREKLPTIEAGRLRHRVTIQRQTQTQNAQTGELTVAWTDVATVWAAVEPISAREFIAAQEPNAKITARVTIRYRGGIDASMRLIHRGRRYNIQGVLEDMDSGREYLTLPVSEGVNDEGAL